MAKKPSKSAKKSSSTKSDSSPKSAKSGTPVNDVPVSADEKAALRDEKAAAGKGLEKRQVNQRKELLANMQRSIVTEPLLSQVQQRPDDKFDVILALNELYKDGMEQAHRLVRERATQWNLTHSSSANYIFACLRGHQILEIAKEMRDMNASGKSGAIIYRIWEDSDVSVTLTRSLSTVKADAAQRSFRALGEGIVWAVLDSGVQGTHPHFSAANSSLGPVRTLQLQAPVVHRDFTPDGRARAEAAAQTANALTDSAAQSANASAGSAAPAANSFTDSALEDRLGHGTHVAGIIAGLWESLNPAGEMVVGTEMRNESTDEGFDRHHEKLARISGVAPLCSIVSLKVIADVTLGDDVKQTQGQGKVSWILMAIEQIQQWNQYGKRLLVHGVNMSVGYDFDPRWFACGQSPLCVEVNRLVRCGVSVVVSAGNGGYPAFYNESGMTEAHYSDMSITDPGNAELAITVGSTHRESPHTYGVSYFSSRGPTGDGRMKPDLLAPGERIRSCAAGLELDKFSGTSDGDATTVLYCEQSGTSMAAPHVSGAVAAFLSTRSEYIGEPERVKALMLSSAVDLGRQRHFQGAGLLDLMKVLQAV